MKIAITAIAAILLIASTASVAYAEVPGWVKNNAGWWADGTISESEFLTGIEFLIKDGVIDIPPTTTSSSDSEITEQSVPVYADAECLRYQYGCVAGRSAAIA